MDLAVAREEQSVSGSNKLMGLKNALAAVFKYLKSLSANIFLIEKDHIRKTVVLRRDWSLAFF